MVFYIFLSVFSVLCGLGMLRICRVDLDPRFSICIAPLATLSLWSLLLEFGLMLGYPVRHLWMIFYVLSVCLAGVGLWFAFSIRKEVNVKEFFLVILLPVALMFPYFWHGILQYAGSPTYDGWSYAAVGLYFWSFPPGTDGGLTPLYQYGEWFKITRFVAHALLGFLSPITGQCGDTQAISGVFLAWGLFVYSSGAKCFINTRCIDKTQQCIYVTLVVFSPWITNLLHANNYDNLLFIAYPLGLASLSQILDPERRGSCFVIAIFVVAGLVTYPEFAPLLLLCSVIFFAQRIINSWRVVAGWMKWTVITLALCCLLLLPLTKKILTHFFHQFLMVGMISGPKGGSGVFPHLLDSSHFLPNVWGLYWENFQVNRSLFSAFLQLMAILLTALSAIGIYDRVRQRDWAVVIVALLLWAGAVVMIFGQEYDYGAYKMLNLGWWAACYLAVAGAFFLARRYNTYYMKAILCCLTGAVLTITAIQIWAFDASIDPKSIDFYKQVRSVKNIIGNSGVAVYLNKELATRWAAYFLRDVPIRLENCAHHLGPYVAAKPRVDQTRYLLTDMNNYRMLNEKGLEWSGGPYRLWNLEAAGGVSVLSNSNGLEKHGEKDFMWLGGSGSLIEYWSQDSGTLALNASYSDGPSLPETAKRRILFSSDQGFEKVFEFSGTVSQTIEMPVGKGHNKLRIRPLDTPTVKVLPNGDFRPLLVGVSCVSLEFIPRELTPDLLNQDATRNGK
jgi:hypothetical protein